MMQSFPWYQNVLFLWCNPFLRFISWSFVLLPLSLQFSSFPFYDTPSWWWNISFLRFSFDTDLYLYFLIINFVIFGIDFSDRLEKYFGSKNDRFWDKEFRHFSWVMDSKYFFFSSFESICFVSQCHTFFKLWYTNPFFFLHICSNSNNFVVSLIVFWKCDRWVNWYIDRLLNISKKWCSYRVWKPLILVEGWLLRKK